MKTILAGDRDNDNLKLMSTLVNIKRTRCDRRDKHSQHAANRSSLKAPRARFCLISISVSIVIAKRNTNEGGNDEKFCLIFNFEIFASKSRV